MGRLATHCCTQRKRGREAERKRGIKSRNPNFVNTPKVEIVEAQGWVVDANGDIRLVAHVPTVTPHGLRNSPSGCQVLAN